MTSHQHATPPLFDRSTTSPRADQPTPRHPAADQPSHPYHRLHHDPISDQPQRGETGFVTYARELARAVCTAAGGSRWEAEATSPAWPTREADQHTKISTTIDEARQVVLATTSPAGGGLEQWTITIDGQPIPHRALPGEVPHHVAPVARSVWRHLNGVSVEACDRLMCREPATVATWGSSTCVSHAAARPAATRPTPSATPPPLPRPTPRPGRGSQPHWQQPGMRR
jgi:hypothetical protein